MPPADTTISPAEFLIVNPLESIRSAVIDPATIFAAVIEFAAILSAVIAPA